MLRMRHSNLQSVQLHLRAGLSQPVWPSGKAVRLVSGKTSVRYRCGSPFSSKVVVCGHGLVTLSLTINETLKRLSSLPILMQVILVVTV